LGASDTDSWEPPDVVKGDIARATFCMATRCQGAPTNEPPLFLTDWRGQSGSAANLMGRLTTLLARHEMEPVDARERRRNDLVFERYQRNRNPFVDRPLSITSTRPWPGARCRAPPSRCCRVPVSD
jgi:endonuclease I